MTFLLVNRVRETCISPGTGTAVLAGAALGYQTFSAGVGANNTTYYVIADQSGANWEVGYGTVGALGTTLARTTVLSSSNGGSLVNFTSGTQDVWVDYPANKAVFQDSTGTVSVPVLLTTSTTSTTPNLSFNASNTGFAVGASVSGSYLQSMLQNKSGTAGASTNYVLSNDLGTDSSYYGEFGMNSSVYSSGTPTDFYSINNGIYFSGHDGDITFGSGNGFKSYFAWGSSGQSAHVINASGALGFSTNLGTTPALSGTTGYGTAGQVPVSAGSTGAVSWSSTPTLTGTNFTGVPISTAISGLGTGVASALAIAIGSAGAPITFSGALGTPSSGTLTNTTGFPAANLAGTALPAAIVSSSLTSVGTIGTGVWQGSVIGASYGGTGVAGTLTGILYGNGSSAHTVATNSQLLTLLGTLGYANGGTGLTTTPGNGVLDIGNGSGFTRTTLTAGSGITITNSAGSITIQTSSYTGNYLLVAGGGSGSDNTAGGGGGAGGVITGSQNLLPGSVYNFIIGSGGAVITNNAGNNGNNSTAFGFTAIGGGAGGNYGNPTGSTGNSGGSGGGGGFCQTTAPSFGGSSTTGQGNAGGQGGTIGTGGGGGAGSVGGNASSTGGGNGGNGILSSITGTGIYYGGGGGGEAESSGTVATTGGLGGGGAGAYRPTSSLAVAGSANTGGGGGGGSNQIHPSAGAGGSGVFILSIPTSNYTGTTTGSPTIITSGSYTILKFTSSGSYTA